MHKAFITGVCGMLGSEMARLLLKEGWQVIGCDLDLRGHFFGTEGSTASMQDTLQREFPDSFYFVALDIRDKEGMKDLFINHGVFDLIVATAAQPSHEYSTNHAIEDFEINALGSVNVLENFRQYSPDAVFIHASTSKVYGDHVNELPLVEKETRFDLPEDHKWYNGVDESMDVQRSSHSLFGSSKLCGDIMAQEYARYFGLKIAIFRPVCITSSSHKGVPHHGYLAYLVKCIATGQKYIVNGYKGKQVRGNIHAFDLVSAFYEVYKTGCPFPGEFYNIDGGRQSNNSIIEAIAWCENYLEVKANVEYSEVNRRADHRWCIFDNAKFQSHYPNWKLTYNNDRILTELCEAHRVKETI